MSNSMRPHRRQPTRLLHPQDSPGKNIGVGCHFLLRCMKVKSLSRARLLATPWTGAHQAPPSMGFSSQEHWSGVPLPSPTIISTTGQKSLGRDGVVFIVNRVQNAVLWCCLKNDRMISVSKAPFNITVIQVYASTTNAEEDEVQWFCEDLQDIVELTTTTTKMSFSS